MVSLYSHLRFKSVLRAFASFMALSLLAVAPATQAKSIALLIGVQNYHKGKINDSTYLTPSDLKGPRADVDAMSRVLKVWGVEDIRILLDEQATQKNIVTAVAQLLPDSHADDQIIIYFSGHGTSPYNRNAVQQAAFPLLPDQSGAWIPFGWGLSRAGNKESKEVERQRQQKDVEGLVVGRRDLRPVLEKLDQGGRKVLLLSDSCFAGNIARSVEIAKNGGTNGGSKTYVMPSLDEILGSESDPSSGNPKIGHDTKEFVWPYRNLVMLSASSERETAFEIETDDVNGGTFDGQPHGVMTDMLLQVLSGKMPLQGKSDRISYSDLRNTLETNKVRYPDRKRSTISLLPGANEDAGKSVLQTFLNRVPPMQLQTQSVSATVTVSLEGIETDFAQLIAALPGVQISQQKSTLFVRKKGSEYFLFNAGGQLISDVPLRRSLVLERIRGEVYFSRLANMLSQGWASMQTNIVPAISGGYLARCQPLSLAALSDKTAQMLLLALNAEGQIVLLYPDINANRGELIATPANQKIFISPGVFVTPPFGTDQMLVLAVDPSVPGLETLSKHASVLSGIESPLAIALDAYVKAAKGKASFQMLSVRTEDGNDHSCEK